MKRLILFVLAIATFSQYALASGNDCTMTPAPIDVGRIAQRPEIKSYTVDANRLGVTALLKNGRVVRLVHMGCAHSGAEAALWFESATPPSDVATWIKEVVALTKIAFAPDISRDIVHSLQSGKYEKNITDTRLVITASPTEFFSYTVALSPAEHGLILSVTYILG
jgi:hypothetical protein